MLEHSATPTCRVRACTSHLSPPRQGRNPISYQLRLVDLLTTEIPVVSQAARGMLLRPVSTIVDRSLYGVGESTVIGTRVNVQARRARTTALQQAAGARPALLLRPDEAALTERVPAGRCDVSSQDGLASENPSSPTS